VIFKPASSSHIKLAAIHSAVELGIMIKAKLVMSAPTRKYGFRRPQRLDHVLSLMAPMIG
jgi:hypothetical protein